MALDDSVSWVIGLNAMVAATLKRFEEGIEIARRGFDLYPGNADVRAFLGFTLLHAGKYREAVEHLRAAMSLNPYYPLWYRNGLIRAQVFLGEFDAALSLVDEILEIEPSHFSGWLYRAYIFGQTGREADARKAVSEVRRLAPNLRVRDMPGLMLVNDETAMKRFMGSLSEAGLPA